MLSKNGMFCSFSDTQTPRSCDEDTIIHRPVLKILCRTKFNRYLTLITSNTFLLALLKIQALTHVLQTDILLLLGPVLWLPGRRSSIDMVDYELNTMILHHFTCTTSHSSSAPVSRIKHLICLKDVSASGTISPGTVVG